MVVNDFPLWLGMMFPLVFSAGPANIAMASVGARFGLMSSLPFILGINLIVLLQSLLIGFGAGTLVHNYPGAYRYLQYAGAFYLLYLASKFFRSTPLAAGEVAADVPGFFAGIILQSLNMKVITVMMAMFSQFIAPQSGQWYQVVVLSIGLTSLTSCATLTWALGGGWLARRFASGANARLQGYVSGGMLACVSVWMLFQTMQQG
jgi:threonine/homoserine/homoserine lactone efflux protein